MRLRVQWVLVAVAVFGLASGAPGGGTKPTTDKSQEEGDTEFVINSFFPISFGKTFQDMLEAMRRNMLAIIGRTPMVPANLGPGNTTSVVKVINGQKYVINETTYSGHPGNNTDAEFKVQIIDIRPKSEESGETSVENEIPKSKPLERLDRLETLDDPYSAASSNLREHRLPVDLSNDIYVNELAARDPNRRPEPDAEVFLPNAFPQTFRTVRPVRYEAEALKKLQPRNSVESWEEPIQDRLTNLELEEDASSAVEDDYRGHVEPLSKSFSEPIDLPALEPRLGQASFDSRVAAVESLEELPIDLSRDILVNDLADGPLNPDAEFIDFPSSKLYRSSHRSSSS